MWLWESGIWIHARDTGNSSWNYVPRNLEKALTQTFLSLREGPLCILQMDFQLWGVQQWKNPGNTAWDCEPWGRPWTGAGKKGEKWSVRDTGINASNESSNFPLLHFEPVACGLVVALSHSIAGSHFLMYYLHPITAWEYTSLCPAGPCFLLYWDKLLPSFLRVPWAPLHRAIRTGF